MEGIESIKFDTSSYKNNFLATKKQKDYIEKLREKRSEEKKTSEKSEEKKVNSYKKDDTSSVKKVVVEASSEEELIEKIKNVDWNKVSGEKVGARFDFSV